MTKISELNFKTKFLTAEESELFSGASTVAAAVIKDEYPFVISIIFHPESGEDKYPYDILFFDTEFGKPIKLSTIIPQTFLDTLNCKEVSDFTIWRVSEETANDVIDKAETFGKNVADYLKSIFDYKERIVDFPKTMQ